MESYFNCYCHEEDEDDYQTLEDEYDGDDEYEECDNEYNKDEDDAYDDYEDNEDDIVYISNKKEQGYAYK
jgi:hypothetical protein